MSPSGPPHGVEGGQGREAETRLLSVGVIVKPHGLRGDVVVHLSTNRTERLAPGSELEDDDGRRYRVTGARPHKGSHIVRFEGISDVSEAEARRGTELFAPPLSDPDALWIHELIGAVVEDTEGRGLGKVTAVEANPASDLLVLEGGGLVPLRFVISTVPGDRITVDIPDGLLEPE